MHLPEFTDVSLEGEKQPAMPTQYSSSDDGSLNNKVLKSQQQRKVRTDLVRDFIIGYADGMTVPFALTAGLSTVAPRKTIIAAGLLELVGGAISMGGSAFLAASQEREAFIAEELRERERIRLDPEDACLDIAELMRGYQVDRYHVEPLLGALARDPEAFLRFLLDFKHHMSKTSHVRAAVSALAMGLAYFFAGVLPMIPYFCMKHISHALYVSVAVAFIEFSIFGFNNGYQAFGTAKGGLRVAGKTVLVGIVAAGCTYGCGRLLNVVI